MVHRVQLENTINLNLQRFALTQAKINIVNKFMAYPVLYHIPILYINTKYNEILCKTSRLFCWPCLIAWRLVVSFWQTVNDFFTQNCMTCMYCLNSLKGHLCKARPLLMDSHLCAKEDGDRPHQARKRPPCL